MRGHDQIIANRLNGFVPSIVFLNDYPCKTDWFDHREHATVCTHGDLLSSMDLRFLTGLKVSISATTEARAKALFKKAKESGAAVVAACHINATEHCLDQTGWSDVFHMEEVV